MPALEPRPVPTWRAPRVVAVILLVASDLVVLSLEPRSLVRAVTSQSYWVLLAGTCALSARVRAGREPAAFMGWNLLGLSFA